MSSILGPVFGSSAFQFASLIVGILFLLLSGAVIIWLYRDAQSRGNYATIWAGVTAALGVIGAVFGLTQSKLGFGVTGIAAFSVIIVIVFIYLILRPTQLKDDIEEQELSIALLEAELDVKSCPNCHHGIETDFLVCPNCYKILRTPCQHCGRPIKREWKVCPYCKAKQGE